MVNDNVLNYYEILGVNKNATKQDIKAAFRKKAKEFHPDENNSQDTSHLFITINEAYKTLYNDEERNLYDKKLANQTQEKKFENKYTYTSGTSEEYMEQEEDAEVYEYTDINIRDLSKSSIFVIILKLLFKLILFPIAVVLQGFCIGLLVFGVWLSRIFAALSGLVFMAIFFGVLLTGFDDLSLGMVINLLPEIGMATLLGAMSAIVIMVPSALQAFTAMLWIYIFKSW